MQNADEVVMIIACCCFALYQPIGFYVFWWMVHNAKMYDYKISSELKKKQP